MIIASPQHPSSVPSLSLSGALMMAVPGLPYPWLHVLLPLRRSSHGCFLPPSLAHDQHSQRSHCKEKETSPSEGTGRMSHSRAGSQPMHRIPSLLDPCLPELLWLLLRSFCHGYCPIPCEECDLYSQ